MYNRKKADNAYFYIAIYISTYLIFNKHVIKYGFKSYCILEPQVGRIIYDYNSFNVTLL